MPKMIQSHAGVRGQGAGGTGRGRGRGKGKGKGKGRGRGRSRGQGTGDGGRSIKIGKKEEKQIENKKCRQKNGKKKFGKIRSVKKS